MQKTEKIVFHLTNRGNFSEINNLIIAHSYAKALGVGFAIDDRTWLGKFNLGFDDYFECSGIEFYRKGPCLKSVLGNTATGASRIKNIFRYIFNLIYKKIFLQYQKISEPTIRFTPDYWDQGRLQAKSPFVVNGVYADPIEFLNKSAAELLVYNKSVEDFISKRFVEIKNNLGDNYVGLHIRRGDKVNNQMGIIRTKLYVNKIIESGVFNVFVSTDDNQAILELKELLPNNYKIFTFSTSSRTGFSEDKQRRRLAHEKKIEMLELFSDVEALVRSSLFIGTFSSCIGQYVNLRREGKATYSLDNNFYFE